MIREFGELGYIRIENEEKAWKREFQGVTPEDHWELYFARGKWFLEYMGDGGSFIQWEADKLKELDVYVAWETNSDEEVMGTKDEVKKWIINPPNIPKLSPLEGGDPNYQAGYDHISEYLWNLHPRFNKEFPEIKQLKGLTPMKPVPRVRRLDGNILRFRPALPFLIKYKVRHTLGFKSETEIIYPNGDRIIDYLTPEKMLNLELLIVPGVDVDPVYKTWLEPGEETMIFKPKSPEYYTVKEYEEDTEKIVVGWSISNPHTTDNTSFISIDGVEFLSHRKFPFCSVRKLT